MSDMSIPGVSSKYNTDKLVEDLVNAERVRLTRMEAEVEELNETQLTWQQVSRELGVLQRASKSLYGFENPFTEKKVVSSNENVLTATAGRTAANDTYSITVKQIASSDRFVTPSLDKTFRVKGGKYTYKVGEESVTLQYRGGTLEDFTKRLTGKGAGLVKAATVRDTRNTQVMMIEAVPQGSSNRIQFLDDARNLALETDMVRVSPALEGRVTPENLSGELLTVSGSPVEMQSVEVSNGSILIQPETSLRVPFDEAVSVENGMVLEYEYRTHEIDTDEEPVPPNPPGPLWPGAPSGQYQGITIAGHPGRVELPSSVREWSPPEIVDDWDVFKAEGQRTSQLLPPISKGTEYKTIRVEKAGLPSDISAILIENDNTHRSLEIKNIRIFDPSRDGDLEPTRITSTAADAIIEFRGIEATRSSNTIDDLVEGVTFNLKQPSSEAVDLTIEPDSEVAKDSIIRFVFSYNQLLTRLLVLTSHDKKIVEELSWLDDEQRVQMEEQLGRFRGDTSLNQIRNRLQTIISSPHTTGAGNELSLLAQVGISTNASSSNSGSTIDFSKLRGYLEIDEEKLDSSLSTRMDAVKELFGNDTSGDLIIDAGVAKSLDRYLTPLTQTGGLASNRIAGIDKRLKDTREEIADYEEYLKDYEAEMKRQYGTMEAMLNQLENSSRELDNFSRQQGGNR